MVRPTLLVYHHRRIPAAFVRPWHVDEVRLDESDTYGMGAVRAGTVRGGL